MASLAELRNYSNQNTNILSDLTTELQKLHQQFPNRFPKPIHVLPAIYNNVDNQWTQRLVQARHDRTEERIVFIPHNLNDFFWTGVLIKFKTNGRVEHAALVDPVISLTFLLDEVQKQFTKVYSDVIIQSKTVEMCNDREHHASLIIANLVRAIEDAQFSEVQYSGMSRLNCPISDHYNSSTCLSQDDQKIWREQKGYVAISAPAQTNSSTNFHSVQKLSSDLTSLKTSYVPKLLEKIQRTEQRIKDHEEQLEKERKIFIEFRILQDLQEKFGFHQPDVSVYDIQSLSILPQSNDALGEDVISNRNDEKCLIKEEMLRSLHSDFTSMPLCAERCLSTLIFHIFLQLTDTTIASHHTSLAPIWTEIENEFECLRTRLRIEELETIDIQNLMETTFINIKRHNWKIALVTLQKILEHINPLKIDELFRLVEKVNDAARLMQEEDVILFLGGAGVGKSTTIHFLAGSEMKETNVKGLNHILPVKIKNPILSKIIPSPFTQSENPCITPIRINLKDIGGSSNESVILCDSCGFGNTNRPEVDIANAIGIAKTIQGCKSVKPVVLISYESIGDKLSSLKDLAQTLVRIIPEIKDYMKTFSYIFTKFPSNERNRVYALLVNLGETMNEIEKADSDFINLFEDILRKTEKRAVILNPVNDNPLEIFENLIQTAAIKHPEEVFRFSMAEKSKATLQKQMRKHQLSIISAINRAEYDFVKYKLNQLKRLNDLIDQVYIGQIYSDCIEYINRHLLDEYQEGISSLNHCLLNQTVLSDENINRYKIRIDHAKLAEQLRKDHLGKELVHSSAFIEYLNQQVDILLADLKEKDVNDVLVKQTLDKIKFLSNSFCDIDTNRYRHICEVFDMKLKLIVKSFENSVLSNGFDNCAREMAQLSEAFTVLNGHLDHQDMEAKYKQMKEYFLRYLNGSIEKVNHTFIKGQLDQSDIDSLNSCMCMLQTVKTTFALHPHISKEVIDRIYQELLLKIERHFEETVKKILSGIRNKNSFYTLEQFVKELNSIRTISIIKQKTDQSYYSVLEKSIEYLYESIRHIEELLRVLIQRQGKISYHKLRKALSNISEAQWIEKYRAAVISNAMHNVEELLLQHIKEMKQSMTEVNLDLDGYDMIELVQEISTEINEMKYFEKIVPRASQCLAEINICIHELIKNLCLVIKNSFSIEIWKEQGCPIVKLRTAENAFHYLNTCRKIHIEWRTDYMLVLNDLIEFIKHYNDCVFNEMKNCYEKIKQYPNITKEDLFEKAQILSNRLQEISEVKTMYPYVFSCFSNQKGFEQWKKELSSDLTELELQMEILHVTQQTVALNNKLSILKALSKLDSSLEGKKYIDIYHKYQNIGFLQMKDIFKDMLDAIRQNDYETIAYKIVTLHVSDNVGDFFLSQVQRILRIGLNNLVEETKNQAIMLGNHMEIEEVKSIVENLKRIQRAKRFVSQYLDTSDELDICVKEVKKLIEERISRFLESIKAVIIINDFLEVEKRLDSITLVCTILGNYCTEIILNEVEALKERQNNVVLKEVVERYSKMDISEYFFHPPIDIFAKFEAVINTSPKYNEAFNKIKEIIYLKFRKELEQTKLNVSLDSKTVHIRRFESAVKYLPETVRNALEIELKHCKDDIVLLNRNISSNSK